MNKSKMQSQLYHVSKQIQKLHDEINESKEGIKFFSDHIRFLKQEDRYTESSSIGAYSQINKLSKKLKQDRAVLAALAKQSWILKKVLKGFYFEV